jgi:N-acetylglucosamine-6-phosphate deacetylase
MKVWGPNGFERSYTLVESAGEHQPLMIGNVLLTLLPAKWRSRVKGIGARVLWETLRTDTISFRSQTSMKTIFTAARFYTPVEEIKNPLLVVEDGRIIDLSSRSTKEVPANASLVDFGDAILAPGFLDIHIHGGAGLDVMRASVSELPRLGQFEASHGVTGYFPTTVAAPLDSTCAALERLADAIDAAATPVTNGTSAEARPLGIHLEGPFLSHKRRGVHPPENLLEPTVEIFDRLWQAARGHVRVMTIAPEIPGAMEVIAEAARRKVCVSIGHSDAEMPVAQAAVKAGARISYV